MVHKVKGVVTGNSRKKIPYRRFHPITEDEHARVYNTGHGRFKFEANLPLMLSGQDGHLISNQDELDYTIAKLMVAIREHVVVESFEWNYLEIPWHFHIEVAPIIRTLQFYRLPGIGTLPSILKGREIVWTAGHKRWSLKLYDKAHALKNGSGVLRIELMLAGPKLRDRIDNKAPLKISDLWPLFCEIVRPLGEISIPEPSKRSLSEIIALLPAESRSLAMSLYEAGRCRQSVARFRKKVTSTSVELTQLDCLKDLNPKCPPPPIHVEDKRKPRRNLPF